MIIVPYINCISYVFGVFGYCLSHDHCVSEGHECWMEADLEDDSHTRPRRDIDDYDRDDDGTGDGRHCLKRCGLWNF